WRPPYPSSYPCDLPISHRHAQYSAGPGRGAMSPRLGGSHALTMNIYSHVAREISREAADRIARMLWLAAEGDGSDHQKGNEWARCCLAGPQTCEQRGDRPVEVQRYACAARDSNPEPAD